MVFNKEIKKGSVFGRLTTTGKVEQRKVGRGFHPYYECICSCGTKKFVNYFALQSGRTKSCGCLQKEKVGKLRRTHGLSRTRIYGIRAGMKRRCYNSHCKSFEDYGARGIVVCDEWLNSFETFYEDMYPSYLEHVEKFGVENTTIERIDYNGNYCKENCRRATKKEQTANKRKFKGKREKKYGFSERELAEMCGITYGSFRYQLDKLNKDMDALLEKYKLELD